MSNADVIRAMDDRRLRIFLERFADNDIDYARTFCSEPYCVNGDCEDCLADWLARDSTEWQGLREEGGMNEDIS